MSINPTWRRAKVLELRSQGWSYERIGRTYNVLTSRIKQIEREALAEKSSESAHRAAEQ